MSPAGRPEIGPVTKVRMSPELRQRLAVYAERRGLKLAAAAREILEEKLSGIALLPTIWELVPDVRGDAAAVDEALDTMYTEYAEWATAEGEGSVGYLHARGHWIYMVESSETGPTYTVVADEATAEQLMRDEVLRVAAMWAPGEGPIWGDCGYDGDMVERLGKDGLIPPASYTPIPTTTTEKTKK